MNITENIEVHNTLNPKIFRGDIMRQDVRDAALQIVNHFLQQIDMKVNVSDVVLLGSNAAYNYTEDSDFDLHIITNFNRYDANPEIIKELFNARRSNWKNNYDVTIKGYPVEIYVQDIQEPNASNGIYSIKGNEWIKRPKKIELPQYDDFQDRLEELKKEINDVLQTNDAEMIQNKLDDIYLMRRNSISSDGEFGEGNLLFKEIRNLGLKDKLSQKIQELTSADLTLEGLV